MWLKQEYRYTLDFILTRLEISYEIKEYLQNIKAMRERGNTDVWVTQISKENIKWITKEIQDVKNADDFFKCIGDDYEMPEYEAILYLLKEKPRDRVVKAELEYREAKYVEILHTIRYSLVKGEYTQHISGNMEKYENEYVFVKSLYKRYDPSNGLNSKNYEQSLSKKIHKNMKNRSKH
ncbi:hypothetical protein JTB14_029344 [Gonioctena quinquepunctata]|nr:hypothetical protein JTB14_029344 [Gonioctena quinquepunctata]